MFIRLLLVLLSLAIALPSMASMAEEKAITTDDSVDIHAIPPILNPEYRHISRGQFEIAPYGGSYLGSTIGQTWLAGARGMYHLNNTWSFGAMYGYSNLLTNQTSPFGQVMTNNAQQTITVIASVSNDAAFRAGNKQFQMDFYLTFGAGTTKLNGAWEPVGQIGGGVKFYTGLPWLAFRIDVDNFAHFTNLAGSSQFDFDVCFLGGVSFLFPSKPSAYEKK